MNQGIKIYFSLSSNNKLARNRISSLERVQLSSFAMRGASPFIAVQLALMLLSSATFFHIWISEAINLANSSGLLVRVTTDLLVRDFWTSGMAMTRTTSSFNRLMMGAGVPAGASRPYQRDAFMSTPNSWRVGTVGWSFKRSLAVTAKALRARFAGMWWLAPHQPSPW